MNGIAELFAKKAMNYVQKNPNKIQSWKNKAMNYASRPNVQEKFKLGVSALGRKGMNFLEKNPGLLNRLMQKRFMGGKTRKQLQKRKQRKTRKH
jgi:hypothetical protein